ncbi:hypothetical protein CEUSTIGMA_g7698.t1 [Chlamydomonas eustigma]|uniref:Uncharacterized protein n=1 Tax=Chlamydomonas eustigma TaxID=1157962 RepID=A0A250XBW9_9CHLO|nr:hypothetical protein CEUSTIGMA_g7698.t1 [Chlamydomonas eustigma]|eukprot:GAX80260.1 hypothetical protein CEUSTIGMA_g7698.t1 [Chlamydomonas eustigma]
MVASYDSWKHTVAGGVAGSVAVLTLHPFDVVKTRLQVQDGQQVNAATYRGAVDAARNIYKREGLKAFYSGLTPAWLGSGLAWASYFYTYEKIKAFYLGWQGGDRLGTWWHSLSAAQAGALVCLVTNPIWVIKTRLQLQQSFKVLPSYTPSLIQAGVTHAANNAPPATVSVHTGVKPALHPSSIQASSLPSMSLPLQGTARSGGAISSGSSAVVPYKSMLDAFLRIGKEEGLKGYYKGLAPSLLLQTCHGAIQFTVYEEMKYMLARRLPDTSTSTSLNQIIRLNPKYALAQQPAGKGLQTASAALPSSVQLLGENSRTSAVEVGVESPALSKEGLVSTSRQLSSLETSACAVLSKLAASVSTYPSQVIRSRLQQRLEGTGREVIYRTSLNTVALTWKNEGIKGFYRGLGPALLRVLPQSALTMMVYEKVLTVLPNSS